MWPCSTPWLLGWAYDFSDQENVAKIMLCKFWSLCLKCVTASAFILLEHDCQVKKLRLEYLNDERLHGEVPVIPAEAPDV